MELPDLSKREPTDAKGAGRVLFAWRLRARTWRHLSQSRSVFTSPSPRSLSPLFVLPHLLTRFRSRPALRAGRYSQDFCAPLQGSLAVRAAIPCGVMFYPLNTAVSCDRLRKKESVTGHGVVVRAPAPGVSSTFLKSEKVSQGAEGRKPLQMVLPIKAGLAKSPAINTLWTKKTGHKKQ